MEDGIVKEGAHSIEQGVGVRAISGEKTGFAYSDEINTAALLEASKSARAIARDGSTQDPRALARGNGRALYRSDDPIDSMGNEDKVELLENYVVLKMPRNPSHDGTIQTIQDLLYDLRPPGWSIRTQSSVTLGDSQPEPDLAVVRKAPDNYRSRHPGPDDFGLLIEVADSSLARDQLDKARIYARASIPIYWIVTLTLNLVLVFALVPRYGAQGAAIASSISYAMIFALVALHFHTSTGRSFSEVFVLGSLRG